jgi:DNA-binding IclR family transcriptional regulator
LRSDIATTRARGFSLNPGRLLASSWGIGRAFRYPDGRVAGALSIAAIDSRMVPARQAELSLLLAREAERLEALLKQMFVSKRAVRPIVAAAPRSIETGRAAR